MTHEEAQELLAVYSLNAIDGVERDEIEEHVQECVRCSSELDGLRGVATSMGNVGEPASPEIWEKISARLYEDVELPPIRALNLPNAAVAPITSLSDARRARSRTSQYVMRGASAAAAALVGILGINLVHADSRANQLQNALAIAPHHVALAALEAPGHIAVTLTGTHIKGVTQFVLLNGHGYMLSWGLPPLSPVKTYQLWGMIAGKPISIGLMGNTPFSAEFSVAGSLQPSELAITVEPAGGSSTPTTPIIASGMITA